MLYKREPISRPCFEPIKVAALIVVLLMLGISLFLESCGRSSRIDPSLLSTRVALLKKYEVGRNEQASGEILFNPIAVRIDDEGNIYVLDLCSIFKFSSSGAFLKKCGHEGKGPGELSNPCNFCVDARQNVFVLDNRFSVVSKFRNDGKFEQSFRVVSFPNNIAVDSHDNIFVSSISYRYLDSNGTCTMAHIFKYDSTGRFLFAFGDKKSPSIDPTKSILNDGYLSVDESDHVFFCFKYSDEIREYNDDGKLIRDFSNHLGYDVPEPEAALRVSSGGREQEIRYTLPWICRGLSCGGRQTVWTVVPVSDHSKSRSLDPMFVDVFDSAGRPYDRILLQDGGFVLSFAVSLKVMLFTVLKYDSLATISIYKVMLKK